LRHRGPDWSGYRIVGNGKHGIAHERLAIIDPESGAQPLTSHDGTIMLAVNGEIYNYKELYQNLHKPYTPKVSAAITLAISGLR
jgi:asparagine synthase (glutamine-hydrolysing)